MQGTAFENNWYFYHDALSQMTNKDTVEWMKEKGYYSHWLLPILDLHKGTVYSGRPVGDSPEFMPLDTSLFQDLHMCALSHVLLTEHLDKHDERKFSFDMPCQPTAHPHTFVSRIQPPESVQNHLG